MTKKEILDFYEKAAESVKNLSEEQIKKLQAAITEPEKKVAVTECFREFLKVTGVPETYVSLFADQAVNTLSQKQIDEIYVSSKKANNAKLSKEVKDTLTKSLEEMRKQSENNHKYDEVLTGYSKEELNNLVAKVKIDGEWKFVNQDGITVDE